MKEIFNSLLAIHKEIPKQEIKTIDELYNDTFLCELPKKIRKKLESELFSIDFEDESLISNIEMFIFSCYHLSARSLKSLVINNLLTEQSINSISKEDFAKLRSVGEKTANEIIAFKQIVKDKEKIILKTMPKSNLSLYFNEKTITELNNQHINSIEEINAFKDTSNLNEKEKRKINKLIEINKEQNDLEVYNLYDIWKRKKEYTIGQILGIDKNNIDSVKFLNNNSYSDKLDLKNPSIGGSFLEMVLVNKLNDISTIYQLTYEQINAQIKLTALYESKLKNLIINNIIIVKQDKLIFATPANYIYSQYNDCVLKTTNEKDYLICIKNIEILLNKVIRKQVSIKKLKMIMLQDTFIKDLSSINKSESHAVEIFKNIYYGNRHENLNVLKNLYQEVVINVTVDEVIKYLMKREVFELNDKNKVVLKKRSLKNFIQFIDNERHQQVLTERLAGKTLEESSASVGMTRERARQIIDKIFHNLNEQLLEDRYKEIFQRYYFSQEEFSNLFKVDAMEYYYLLNRYDIGEKEITHFVNEDQFELSEEVLENIITYKNKDYIIIDNEKIKKSKYEILEYLLKYFCTDLTKVHILHDLYHEFIDEFNLKESLKVHNKGSFENTMERLKSCIVYPNKRIRYYPFDKYNWQKFYKELSIDIFMDKEISTIVLFENQKELMDEYGIKDHFELHNIIRKSYEKYNLPIEMGRNPHIRIGNDDIDYQILELLIELAPISQGDFVYSFSQKYGIRQDTLMANTYLDVIEEYLQNGVYHINNDYLSNIDLDYLNIQLKSNDFHFIDEIKKGYLSHVGSELLATEYVFKQLGFKMGSSYIYSDQFGSFIEYMKKTIFYKDIVNITNLPYRMKNLSTFRAYTQKLVENHEFIEFEFEKYISVNRLSQNGMTNDVIDKYIDNLMEQLEDGKIYSIQTILNNKEDNIFEEYGFGLRFYESMFRRDKNNRRIYSLAVGGTLLIRKLEKINSFTDLLQQIIDEYRSFEIYDLIYYLKEEYHIETHRSFILESVKECDMYFNEIMGKIYIDNDYYYEELE